MICSAGRQDNGSDIRQPKTFLCQAFCLGGTHDTTYIPLAMQLWEWAFLSPSQQLSESFERMLDPLRWGLQVATLTPVIEEGLTTLFSQI